MTKVTLLNKTSPLINKIFSKDYQLIDASKNPDACPAPDAIIVRSFKMQDYNLPESVLGVARAGAGVNNIPVDKYAEKGVVVFNTPGANANAVKELVLCAMFMCGRKIYDGINWAQSLKGQPDVAKKIEDGKSAFTGGEIMGKTIGVIGLGAIGILVANACAALGMQILGYDPGMSTEKAQKLDKKIKLIDSLDKLYPECDYITLHVPLVDATKNMVNAQMLAKCKDGVNIINCARGELGNNADIIAGINSGKINRYVTDFPTDEVLGIEKIIPVPHLGASTPEAEDNCAVMAAEQLVDFIENGNVVNSVNFPAVKMDHCDCKNKKRITVAYKGEIDFNAVLSGIGIKACQLKSAKKGDFGYAIIDTENAAKADELKKIKGVLKVRII